MNSIGRYLLFVISLAGMILSGDTFSEESKKEFLDHLYLLHNTSRAIYDVPPLKRNPTMDNEAHQILMDYILQEKHYFSEKYGLAFIIEPYNENFKLNIASAKLTFATLYMNNIATTQFAKKSNTNRTSSEYCVWNTKEMGMAVGRNRKTYAVVFLYFPRCNMYHPVSNDQAGPSNTIT